MNYFNKTKLFFAKSKIALLILCLILSIGVCFIASSSIIEKRDAEASFSYDVSTSELIIVDYSVIDGKYVPLSSDPQIYIPTSENKINDLKIVLTAPLSSPLDFQLYYATNNEGLTEANSITQEISKGQSEVYFSLPEGVYTSLRLDVNKSFGIKSVSLSYLEAVSKYDALYVNSSILLFNFTLLSLLFICAFAVNKQLQRLSLPATLASLVLSFVFSSLLTYNKVFDIETEKLSIPFVLVFAGLFIAFMGCILLFKRYSAIPRYLKSIFTVFEKSPPSLSSLVLGAVVFFLTFHLTLTMPVDYGFHTGLASSIDFSDLKGIFVKYSTPLWHIFTRAFSLIFNMPAEYAAALTSSLLVLLTYRITLGIIRENTHNEFAKKYAPYFSAMLMFVQPIYLPWFNEHQIYGQGSPNIIHNPTNITAKPFAIISAYLIVKLLQKLKNGEKIQGTEYIKLSLFMFISVLAKPSAIQVIMPAVAIILLIELIKSKGKIISTFIKTAAACIPAFAWMLFSFYLNFISDPSGSSGGLTLSFFKVWRAFSDCIPLSILLVTLFPLAEIAVYRKSKTDLNKLGILFSIVTLIIGIAEYGFIMETGYRQYHGNFSWGYNIALGLFWTFATSHLLEKAEDKEKGSKWSILCTLFVIHFLCGAYYYFSVL